MICHQTIINSSSIIIQQGILVGYPINLSRCIRARPIVARCSPSECSCGLNKAQIQIRAQGIHRTANRPKGRVPHAASLASQAQLLMHPRNKMWLLLPNGLQR